MLVLEAKDEHMNRPCFDKATYAAANDRIIEMVKESHDWENTEGFIADGVICPDEYEKQSMRIVCILAESYGYDGCRATSIESQPNEDVLGVGSHAVKAPRKLSTLIWLLQRSFEQGSKVSWDDMPWLFRINRENTNKLQHTLKKVAWINVKKASRHEGTAMVPEEVHAHALRNKTILRQQIEVTAPDLIIVCGRVVFCALHVMNVLGREVLPGRQWQVQAVEGGPRVLEVSHPRNWWAYAALYQHFEEVYAQIA